MLLSLNKRKTLILLQKKTLMVQKSKNAEFKELLSEQIEKNAWLKASLNKEMKHKS
jgi:hypothetical protein